LEPQLLRRPGITGVSNVGNTLRIYVEGTDDDFPAKIDNFPVEVFKTGPIKALSQLSQYQQPETLSGAPWIVPQASVDPLRTGRYRPVPGGVCFDEKTRVLTKRGFLDYTEITYEDKIATLKEGKIEFLHPTHIYIYDYSGPMVHFNGQRVDHLVTPNHRLYVRRNSRARRKKNHFEIMIAKDAVKYSHQYLCFTNLAKWDGNPNWTFEVPDVQSSNPWSLKQPRFNPEDFAEFMGWYLSEGYSSEVGNGNYIVGICNEDPQNRLHFMELFKRLGLNPQDAVHQVIVRSKKLWSYCKRFGTAKYKFIPPEIQEMPPRLLKRFFEAMIKGDGHKDSTRSRYYSSSRRLRDGIAIIGIKLGYNISLGYREREGGGLPSIKGKHEEYLVSFHKPTLQYLPKASIIENYKGIIWDVTVKNHVIYVERNGKTCWTGNSIGHRLVTAGTHGVSLRFLGLPYGLSNNHVLAAGSTLQYPRANIGDGSLQPGVYDGGTLDDAVGSLHWYMPIDTGGPNLVDAALWEPYSPDLMSDEILEIGVPRGLGTVQVGDIVQKSGRTSGLLSAEVIDVNATVNVGYGDFSADFHNQIITDLLGQPGDSGSAVLDMVGPNLVGLLFAGSDYVTIHNHIGNVLDAIGTTIPPTQVGRPNPVPFLLSNAMLVLSLLW